MNKIVANILLNRPIPLFFGEESFLIHPPTTKTMLSLMSITGGDIMNVNEESLSKVLSFICDKEIKVDQEALLQYKTYVDFAYASDYFSAIKKHEMKEEKAKTIGGETMAGWISDTMEDLKMSYSEVLNTPYPALLVLRHDKTRIDYDKKDKRTEISDEEMYKRKKG